MFNNEINYNNFKNDENINIVNLKYCNEKNYVNQIII